uniref:Uncharacterized protein n=1 Tax=Oryza nivara TaxID=4536 RepID=A0A0E0J0S9_ORYNI
MTARRGGDRLQRSNSRGESEGRRLVAVPAVAPHSPPLSDLAEGKEAINGVTTVEGRVAVAPLLLSRPIFGLMRAREGGGVAKGEVAVVAGDDKGQGLHRWMWLIWPWRRWIQPWRQRRVDPVGDPSPRSGFVKRVNAINCGALWIWQFGIHFCDLGIIVLDW